ncbi:MAG: ammonium transporter [Flavobacteriaceae bacterium]|nr:MAG: ammonium transporter [Flavobacteriaceae bacterium]
MMVSIMLVFIMHLGFSTLEIGLTRSKNTVNILFKNMMIVAVGLVTYAICGFNLMYPGDFGCIEGVLGFAGFGVGPAADYDPLTYHAVDGIGGTYTYWTDFLFQGMFAATAATIVSGAVAERFRLDSFFIFSILYVGLVYPIVGSWQWGGGWLSSFSIGESAGFHDFAGSTLVHTVGGWAALVAVYLVGPRIGKYVDGKINAIQGHNIPLAAIGVFLLWFGWFGFNGGSVLSADPETTSKVLVTTCMAAAAGALSAVIVSLVLFKSYDLSMGINGILAGLVGITAGADQMGVMDSIWIGIIAGAIVVGAVAFFDRLKLDDPVGALAVHLACGIWGTLAVGIFGAKAGMDQFLVQLIGLAATGATCIISSLVILLPIKALLGLRVSEIEEIEGLDMHEHQMEAYPDFRIDSH